MKVKDLIESAALIEELKEEITEDILSKIKSICNESIKNMYNEFDRKYSNLTSGPVINFMNSIQKELNGFNDRILVLENFLDKIDHKDIRDFDKHYCNACNGIGEMETCNRADDYRGKIVCHICEGKGYILVAKNNGKKYEDCDETYNKEFDEIVEECRFCNIDVDDQQLEDQQYDLISLRRLKLTQFLDMKNTKIEKVRCRACNEKFVRLT